MDTKEQHIFTHFEELRRRLLVVLISFIVSCCGGFVYVDQMYDWLVMDLDGKLAILGPTDILWVYFVIAGSVAVGITIPIAGFQVWQFVKPALSQKERTATLMYIPALAVLFAAGISFGYFVLFPMVLSFMQKIAADQVIMMYTADKYFRFLMNMTLPFGLLFELPVVVMFLTKLGILNPSRLAKARKLAYFLLIVISISITPPDFISDILVTVPLLILYEASVTLSRIVYFKRSSSGTQFD